MTPAERAARMAEIARRERAATKGPWVPARECVCIPESVDGDCITYEDGNLNVYQQCHDEECTCLEGAMDLAEANHEFIAHARADIPWLLAEVRRLEGMVKEMEPAYVEMQIRNPSPELREQLRQSHERAERRCAEWREAYCKNKHCLCYCTAPPDVTAEVCHPDYVVLCDKSPDPGAEGGA